MPTYIQMLTGLRPVILVAAFGVGGVIFLGYQDLPWLLPPWLELWLWKINSLAIFLVMLIRPLSDLLPTQKWLRALIPLRKELGILSAMIVVSFGLARYTSWGWSEFLATYFSFSYWPFPSPEFWGRVGELVGVPLLLTSNLWAQVKLKRHWKTIQRLSYVYFFAGAYYVYAVFEATEEIYFMVIVLVLTLAAFGKKRWARWQRARAV